MVSEKKSAIGCPGTSMLTASRRTTALTRGEASSPISTAIYPPTDLPITMRRSHDVNWTRARKQFCKPSNRFRAAATVQQHKWLARAIVSGYLSAILDLLTAYGALAVSAMLLL